MAATRPLVLTMVFCVASMFIACTSAIVDNPAANDDGQAQKALLVILDGWGIGDKSEGDGANQDIAYGYSPRS